MKHLLSTISKASFAVACVFACSAAHAALVGGNGNWVQSIKVESGLIYISFDYPIGGTCGNRLWVDPATAAGKANHATAMLGFSLPKTVRARAYEEAQRVNGACQLFDLEVSNA
ncbi:hypothetical protein [Mitsuaria sp. GD03876]|uniref:hypothetical protein n=1 Tax=Mitsuaria sp. GD03876 TaxID=2975399 RepID=UPI00244A977F|nr:hypothetical protein [Mitsuaria sp. GD03876]MDH0864691.1 hypothetical protein [Mitsuaria sp. GD03876]